MERVQFQQEKMLAELKDLQQKGIFSQDETKHIMKKRTAFEINLIRRIPKKVDFMRYVAYEMGLEALRQKRVKRLQLPKGPSSVSDYALIRRQFQLFERALRKFKDDVALWVQYIRTAQSARARALVSRLCGRALSLHPGVPALYVLAAAHELKHMAPSAARVLLQRGLRMNGESVLLWKEYAKMEMGFVEGLRRRWSVLGISMKDEEKRRRDTLEGEEVLMTEGLEEEGEPIKERRGPENPNEDDEETRKMILNGALVKTVISSAVKAIPTPDLFIALHAVLSSYPCPPTYQHTLLEYLFSLMQSTLFSISTTTTNFIIQSESLVQCARLYTERYLIPAPEGESLVDALQRSNEDLLQLVQSRRTDDIAKVYADFVEEWYEKGLDEHLNLYLLASLHRLRSKLSLPSLYSTRLCLLRSSQNTERPSSPSLEHLEKRYSPKLPALTALN